LTVSKIGIYQLPRNS